MKYWQNINGFHYAVSCNGMSASLDRQRECALEIVQILKNNIAVDRLIELVEADKEGRIVVLPCKVGDTVFTIELDCKDNPDHSQMCFCWNKSCKECDKSYLRVWENRNKTADIRSIVAEMGLCGESGGFGKTVFLTESEAQAALERSEHHDGNV